MEDIKMVALDLGGTLLRDNNTISPQDIETLRLAKEKGILITMITARMYSSTKYISSVIKSDYGVFSNGSHLLDINSLKTLKRGFLCIQAVLELINLARRNNLYIHVNQEFYEAAEELDFFDLKHTLLNKTYPDGLKSNIVVCDDLKRYVEENQRIMKAVLVSENELDGLLDTLQPLLEKYGLFITEHYQNIFESAINKNLSYIEIGSNKDDKAKGLQELLRILRLNDDQVLVIGDGVNDREMISTFENSACMGNGHESIKKLAKYVTTRTNNEAGVSEAINHFIKL